MFENFRDLLNILLNLIYHFFFALINQLFYNLYDDSLIHFHNKFEYFPYPIHSYLFFLEMNLKNFH